MDIKGMGFNSKSIHAGHEHEGRGSHVTPIYQVSTFRFKDSAQGGRIFAGIIVSTNKLIKNIRGYY